MGTVTRLRPDTPEIHYDEATVSAFERAETVGARVAALRAGAGLSAAALGELIGLDGAMIEAAEAGTRSLDGVELAGVADALDVSVRDLLGLGSRVEMRVLCVRRPS